MIQVSGKGSLSIMEEALSEAFERWTNGRTAEDAKIAVFEQVRDIPYAITPELNDPKTGTAGILKCGKGSCNPKHFLLGALYEKLEIPVRYVSFPFRWSEAALPYPDDILELAKQLPHGNHLACQAFIKGRWILLDATWDLPLKEAGFPVNTSWNGSSATRNAMKPLGEIVHKSLEERVRFASDRKKDWTDQDRSRYSEFIILLNAWVEGFRSGVKEKTP